MSWNLAESQRIAGKCWPKVGGFFPFFANEASTLSTPLPLLLLVLDTVLLFLGCPCSVCFASSIPLLIHRRTSCCRFSKLRVSHTLIWYDPHSEIELD